VFKEMLSCRPVANAQRAIPRIEKTHMMQQDAILGRSQDFDLKRQGREQYDKENYDELHQSAPSAIQGPSQ